MSENANKQARMNSLLNRKRKGENGNHSALESTAETSSAPNRNSAGGAPEGLNSAEEKRKATELILREAKRAKERAEKFGPQGWLRPKSLNTNKQFLHRTLAATLPKRKPKTRKSPDKRV